MTAFDADVLSDFFKNVPAVVGRFNAVPADQRRVPVVVAEEMLRGRLDAIRKAQQDGSGRLPPDRAYALFAETLAKLNRFAMLPYSAAADAQFKAWRAAKIRVGSNDLRIAAICQTHGATLVTRNARDYAQVPGLLLDVWN